MNGIYLGDRVQCKTPYGYIFADPADISITTWLVGGEGWEFDLTTQWCSWINPGSTVIDIGANVGWFSLAARHHGAATIYSFECNPKLNRLLTMTSQINPALSNWTVCNVALSNRHGLLPFVVDPVLNGGGCLQLGQLQADTEYVEASLIPLDDYNLSSVNAIKIDVEGHERQVWEGMQQTLAKSPNCKVLMEWCPSMLHRHGTNPATFAAELIARVGTVFNARTDMIMAEQDLTNLNYYADIYFTIPLQ